MTAPWLISGHCPAYQGGIVAPNCLRAREVARTFGTGRQVDDATRERVEMLTRSMVRKLLHGPVTRLREAGDPATALAIREAFRLDR